LRNKDNLRDDWKNADPPSGGNEDRLKLRGTRSFPADTPGKEGCPWDQCLLTAWDTLELQVHKEAQESPAAERATFLILQENQRQHRRALA
jgi:hypothetical protein